MLLLHLSKTKHAERIIPIKRYSGGPRWSYPQEDWLDHGCLTFSNVLAEPKLTGALFDMDDFPEVYENLKPDVLVADKQRRTAILIEGKTIGEEVVQVQLERNIALCSLLEGKGWRTNLHYLMSLGHENKADWPKVEGKVTLILWEDVLRVMDQIECFRSLFDVDLKPYYQTPQSA